MRSEPHTHENPPRSSDRLHPAVYLGLVLAAVMFALAIWTFSGDRYTDYLLVIVSGFALIAVAIPAVLSRLYSDNPSGIPGSGGEHSASFSEWARGSFETWQDTVRGANAAVEILLPLSAIAIGMLAIGIVLRVTEHGT